MHMSYSQTVLDHIKKQLSEEKERQTGVLSSLVAQDPFSNPDRLNDNAASDTEANEESSHERMEALEKTVRSAIEDIDEALGRIEKGTYGVCRSCHKHIDEQRLSVKPTATLCMSCEKKKKL